MRRRLKKAAIYLGLYLLIQNPAYGLTATLEDVVINRHNDDLTISLSLENTFSTEMDEAILNGIPISFSFLVVLYEVKNFWLDKKIVNIKIDHMMKYNVMKKEFVIKRSWEINQLFVTPSFTEAKKAMTEIDNLRILPLDWLENGRHYQLGVKAELRKKNLPLHLRFALFFRRLWDFETDWYLVDFLGSNLYS